MEVLYILLAVAAVAVVIYLCIIKPLMKKSSYNDKQANLYVGMTEAEMLSKCGTPSKTIVIDEHCKLVSYTLDEWKGVLGGGTKHSEITVTIKDGKITNVSTSQ